ncbi:Phage antirepressor protein KilAC domain protein [compost metagenome]
MEGSTLPYQKHIDQGHFQVIEKEFRKAGGEVQTYTQTVVTGKGLTYIQKRLAKESKVA